MLSPLRNPTFRHLFAAQLVALLGTGLATVALGLLAWQLAGDNAGAILGTVGEVRLGGDVAPRGGQSGYRFARAS